jgi:hypothetical protein
MCGLQECEAQDGSKNYPPDHETPFSPLSFQADESPAGALCHGAGAGVNEKDI